MERDIELGTEETNKKEDRQNDKRYMRFHVMYLLLFLICLACYGIVMAVNDVYPFGSKSFLYQDAYDQYTGILQIFLEWLDSGCRSSFLWEYGLGFDMIRNMYYYCMSPFNLLAILLGPEHVELSMTLMIVLKASCLAPAMFYFMRHTRLNQFADAEVKPGFCNAIGMLMSLAYACCGYVLAYEHNVIWLDGLILLPFLAIAVEKLAVGTWNVRYTLLLAAAFVVNFYFAFYLCLFVVLYFLLQKWNDRRDFLRGVLRFFSWSVLAAVLAGIVLLPAFYALLHLSVSGNSDYAVAWNQLGNLGNFINSFYPLNEVTTDYLFNYNNFCGTFTVLPAVVFLCTKNIDFKLRIKYLLTVLFLTAGMTVAGLNYVLHGFTITHGMGNRFSFILTFFFLLLAYVTLLNIRHTTYRSLTIALGVCAAAFLAELFLNKEDANADSYIAFLFFTAAYGMLLFFEIRKSIRPRTFYIWIICLGLIELGMNGVNALEGKVTETRLFKAMQTDTWVADYLAADTASGERKTALMHYDYLPYSETNCYSSMVNGSAIDAFESLGLSHYQNIEYIYRNTSPVTALLYNVRYVLTAEIGTVGGYHLAKKTDGYYLYEADALAGMGFLMNDDITDWSGRKSVAENQNELVSLGTGDANGTPLFEKREFDDQKIMFLGMDADLQEDGSYLYTCKSDLGTGVRIYITADKSEDLYLVGSDTKLQGVDVYINEELTEETLYPESSGMVHIGEVESGDQIEIRITTGAGANESGRKTFAFYALNSDVANEFAAYATENQMTFDGYEGDTLNGTIDAASEGILYLAVPYNEGFTATVDGEDVEVIKLGTGLTGVRVSAGIHKIALTYHTPWLKFGACASLAGILFLAGYVIYRKKQAIPQGSCSRSRRAGCGREDPVS